MGTISFSGLASGIDSTSLIKSLLDSQRSARIRPLESRISSLSDTNSSLAQLQTLLGTLSTAANKFRAINGGGVSKIAVSSDETNLTASSANNSQNASYLVNVASLAKTGTLSFDDRYASSSTVINSGINDGASAADRTVSFTIGTGSEQETVEVELTSTTTVEGLITQFNESSSLAEASVINVGTSAAPSYAIVINSHNQGSERGTLAATVGVSVTAAGSFATSTLDQATDASFSVSGISGAISRSSNTVSDVLGGITLNLRDTGSATVSVSDDSSATTQTVQEFVDAYNEVVKFVSEQNKITRNEEGSEVTNIFGPLASSKIDDNALAAIRSSLSSTTLHGESLSSFADLGITTERDGTLKFDQDIFESALSSNPYAVQTLTENLGETLGAVDGVIAQFIRFNGLIDVEEGSHLSEISSLNDRISTIEKYLSKEQEMLNARYARLESLVGKMNSQESSLAGLIGG